MTDKDKEAFDKWELDYFGQNDNCPHYMLHIKNTWQAACEYKNKEQFIEGSIHESGGIKREMTWKESSDMMENMYQNSIARLDREYKRIRKLQAENKKLREALEFYAKTESWDADGVICGDTYAPWGEQGIEVGGKRAVEALKEVEK
jgi:hypothetical protein